MMRERNLSVCGDMRAFPLGPCFLLHFEGRKDGGRGALVTSSGDGNLDLESFTSCSVKQKEKQ